MFSSLLRCVCLSVCEYYFRLLVHLHFESLSSGAAHSRFWPLSTVTMESRPIISIKVDLGLASQCSIFAWPTAAPTFFNLVKGGQGRPRALSPCLPGSRKRPVDVGCLPASKAAGPTFACIRRIHLSSSTAREWPCASSCPPRAVAAKPGTARCPGGACPRPCRGCMDPIDLALPPGTCSQHYWLHSRPSRHS
jgi:hypothetical protein